MHHIVYANSRQFVCDSERKLTHALVGQIDEAPHIPPPELLAKAINKLTPEEGEIRHTYSRDKVKLGRYEVRLLDWFYSAEAAEAGKTAWADRVNVVVVPVNDVIP